MIVAMLDAYAYRPLVWGIGVETASKPARGEVPDEAVVTAAIPVAETCLRELEGFVARTGWLAGDRLSLADLHAAPMIGFFMRSPIGQEMMTHRPALGRWWRAMSARPAYAATAPSQ